MQSKAQILSRVCSALFENRADDAALIVRNEYPLRSTVPGCRKYTEKESVAVFVRDGYIDRYSGDRLVFPGVLRLLSRTLPAVFPFHSRWKVGECHQMYWDLFPTVDHVTSVAYGGADVAENWVTTSMLRNSAKSHWDLQELGWHLCPAGDLKDWDGLTAWFFAYVGDKPELLADKYLYRWYKAAKPMDSSLSADESDASVIDGGKDRGV